PSLPFPCLSPIFPYTTLFRSVAKQFLMSPALDDFSVLEHQDLVGVADSGKPVCNHETGPALEQFRDCTPAFHCPPRPPNPGAPADRKSTRLNSSHVSISYAVF